MKNLIVLQDWPRFLELFGGEPPSYIRITLLIWVSGVILEKCKNPLLSLNYYSIMVVTVCQHFHKYALYQSNIEITFLCYFDLSLFYKSGLKLRTIHHIMRLSMCAFTSVLT